MDTPQSASNPIVSATLEASTPTIEESLTVVKRVLFALYRDLNYFDPSALARLESATKDEQAVILDNDLGFALCGIAIANDFDIEWMGYAHLMQSLEQKMMIGTFYGKACDSNTYALLITLSIRLATKSISRILAQADPVKAIIAFVNG